MPDYGHDIEFGYFLVPDAGDPEGVVETAVFADRLGYDLLGVQDHPYQRRHLDTLSLLAFILARTERVRVFQAVGNLPLRPPAVFAKAAATLDQLSGGRFEAGLGAGGYLMPAQAMGAPTLTPGQSLEALEEAVAIVRAFWSGESGLRFGGRHYQLHGLKPGPLPAHPISVWLGAAKPRGAGAVPPALSAVSISFPASSPPARSRRRATRTRRSSARPSTGPRRSRASRSSSASATSSSSHRPTRTPCAPTLRTSPRRSASGSPRCAPASRRRWRQAQSERLRDAARDGPRPCDLPAAAQGARRGPRRPRAGRTARRGGGRGTPRRGADTEARRPEARRHAVAAARGLPAPLLLRAQQPQRRGRRILPRAARNQPGAGAGHRPARGRPPARLRTAGRRRGGGEGARGRRRRSSAAGRRRRAAGRRREPAGAPRL